MLHYLQGLLSALDLTSLLDAVLRVAAIFLCLTVHETCHGLAALALGDPTAKSMHRLSLNPLRHIDWIGLLMMFVAGFGWAKPVPVDPRYFRKPKQGMALTALAGPVSNFVLAVLAMLISFQPKVEVTNELSVYLRQHYIITVIARTNIFFQTINRCIKLGYGRCSIFFAYQSPTFLVMFCIDF